MKLIDKDTLLAEVGRIKEMYCYDTKTNSSFIAKAVINSINNAIDSLEVKEVDLDFMLHEYWNLSPKITIDCLESATMTKDEMINFAKYFFELGLKTNNTLTWKDIEIIGKLRLDVALEYRRKELCSKSKFSNKDFCKEVLKRFKAQKGEEV